jgi:hypothetical protein
VHPDFSYNKMDHDVAIIWMATPFEFSDKVKAIDMADFGEEIKDGDITQVTGWGNTRVSTYIPLRARPYDPVCGAVRCRNGIQHTVPCYSMRLARTPPKRE